MNTPLSPEYPARPFYTNASRFLPVLSLLFLPATFPSQARAEATVYANWGYRTIQIEDGDFGSYNNRVFSNNDFSANAAPGFSKTTTNSHITLSASEGRISLLNDFQIGNGRTRRGFSQNVSTSVGAGFGDSLIISDSSRTGQRGTFTGSIRVDLDYSDMAGSGSRNVFGVGIGSNMANARTASQKIFFDNGGVSTYRYFGFGPSDPQSYDNEIVNFTVPFTFGEAFGMAVWMESYIGTDGNTDVATMKSHDASHTVDWAGTVLVEDASGNDLAPGSYALTSASGQDYVAAVPEPSTWLMLSGGVLALALAQRRKKPANRG